MKGKSAGNKYQGWLSDYDVELASSGVNAINKSGEKPWLHFWSVCNLLPSPFCHSRPASVSKGLDYSLNHCSLLDTTLGFVCSSSWPESWQSSAAIPNLLLEFNKPQCVVGSDNLHVKGVGLSEIGI